LAETRFFSTSIMALIYAKIKRTKWVNIEHGSAFVTLSSRFKSAIAKLYDLTGGRLVLRLSDGNVAISQAVSDFVAKFDKRIIPVIYRGLDLDKIDRYDLDYEIKNDYPGKIIIAYVGRLYKWKGAENSIRAIQSLPAEIKNKVVFIIAGSGEDYDRLSKLADESIVLWGDTPHNQAIGLLKATDIYLHSAYPGGGLSTSLLEAMYCGCAVIATPNEGAKEVIADRKNGLLINESSPELIKEKIVELYGKTADREKYAAEAKQMIKENFDWNKNIGKYIEYFEKILKK
jgi:glycosyltransferase involved in cell wall biosynthesis